MVFLMYFNGKCFGFYLDFHRRENGNNASEPRKIMDEDFVHKKGDFRTVANFSWKTLLI